MHCRLPARLFFFILLFALVESASAQIIVRRAAAGTPETLAPTSIEAQTNTTGAVTDIDDDPDSPDGLWLSATAAGATNLRVGFDTPADAPTTGAGLQECRFWLRKDASGGNDPGWRIDVYDAGSVVVSSCATGTLTSATGAIASCTWDAANLTTSDGSGAECYVEQTSGHTGSPPSRRYIETGAVEWNEQ